jgi:hypothetical protein
VLVVTLGGGCAQRAGEAEKERSEPGFRGPIVLISFASLRAGAVGGSDSITPRLDRFLAEATWSGAGVASASWLVGSLASVMTGLPPSVHGASHPSHPWLRPDLPTLAQDLTALGFTTRAFTSNPWSGTAFGLARGFEGSRPLHRRGAERWLAALPEGPSFTWIELPSPGSTAATMVPAEEEEVAGASAAARQPDAAVRQDAAPRQNAVDADYRRRVAEADRRFGRLVESLQRGGGWDRAIVVVLADHGEARDGGEAVAPGREIGRESVEVPFAIRLPAALAGRLTTPAGAVVGLDRLRATLLELVGLRPAPALAPSLLRSSAWVALSELWLANGYHEVGLHEDGHQLRWRCRFAAPDPVYDAAWREALRDEGGAAYGTVIARLDAAARARPGCPEGEEIVLESWPPGGGAAPVDDAARRDRMVERLRAIRHFPPAFCLGPAPPGPSLRRRDFFSLAGWGLPLPRQWWSGAAPTESAD